MKKCPYCAEEIQDEAVFCRHCQRDLVTQPVKVVEYNNPFLRSLGGVLLVLGWLILAGNIIFGIRNLFTGFDTFLAFLFDNSTLVTMALSVLAILVGNLFRKD